MSEYGGWNLKDLKECRAKLMDSKKGFAKCWGIADSQPGKDLIERKRAELESVLLSYSAIKPLGKDPSEVVMMLLVNQTQEKAIRADLEIYTNAEKNTEMLDEQIKKVDDALRMRKEADAKRR